MISYQFCGKVPNEQILSFYKTNHIEFFVHTSEKEGLPISVAEAESAGIPIIATNAGGTKELLGGNGILLSSDADPIEIADAFLTILTKSEEEKTQLSLKSRQIWENRFDAKKNAREFLEILKSVEELEVKHVVLITEGYPYTDGEKGFLESELVELLKHFSLLIIACLNGGVNKEREQTAKKNLDAILNEETKQRIEVVTYVESWNKLDLIKNTVKFFYDYRTRLERTQIVGSREKRIIRFWESIKYYGKASKFYNWFKCSGILNEKELLSTVIYTYWNLSPTLGICLNRSQINGIRVITRAHGYDYQDEQWSKSLRKPFAETIDELIDKIVFVCNDGVEYYLKKMGLKHEAKKYSYSYLGTKDARKVKADTFPDAFGESFLKNEAHTIVSCDALIPLKRVDKIIDALKIAGEKRPDLDINWVQFGDGPLRTQLMKYAETILGKGHNNY